MKRFIFIAIIIAIFAGCTQITNEIPDSGKSYYVKNSQWQEVDLSGMARSAVPSFSEALEIVSEYNEETNDDQLVIDTEDVPIEESPDVTIYIVNEGDYVELAQYTIPRTEFAERREVYVITARGLGGMMFVDKVPPVPVVPPETRTRHEIYSIYMVNKYDKIVVYQGCKYEKHIDELWDSLDDKTKAGYTNGIDDLMAWYIKAYTSDAVCQTYIDAPWRVVYGQIYTEPVETPVETPAE